MTKNMRTIVLLAATMSLLALGACELFAPRKAEGPETPTPWNTFFINPTLTLENLKYSYENQQNALKYGTILSTGFTFHFAVQDINDYGTPVTWNVESEQEMLVNLHSNLLNKNEYMVLSDSLITTQPDQVNSSNAWIYRKYSITVRTLTQVKAIYRGRYALYLEAENGFWRIKDWFDYRTESNPSWGKLKFDQDSPDV